MKSTSQYSEMAKYHHITHREAKHKAFAKRIMHRLERHQTIDIEGIVPLNIVVKGEVKAIAKPRPKAFVVNVAPNVFDIVYR
jgi:hypothetical protein